MPPGLAGAPWWVWLGGLLGAFNIAASVFLAPRLGALVLAMMVISGQIIASIILDHFGLLGYRRTPSIPTRLLGAVLLVAGAFLAAPALSAGITPPRCHPRTPARGAR